jgi:hypothetical protein
MAGALKKLLKSPPRPIVWFKARRAAPYRRFVVPPCSICGSESAEVMWIRADNGGGRCTSCFTPEGR